MSRESLEDELKYAKASLRDVFLCLKANNTEPILERKMALEALIADLQSQLEQLAKP